MINNFKLNIIKVSKECSSQRLDNFLIKLLKKVPKNMIYRIIRTGKILVNKKKEHINIELNIKI